MEGVDGPDSLPDQPFLLTAQNPTDTFPEHAAGAVQLARDKPSVWEGAIMSDAAYLTSSRRPLTCCALLHLGVLNSVAPVALPRAMVVAHRQIPIDVRLAVYVLLDISMIFLVMFLVSYAIVALETSPRHGTLPVR